MTVSIVKVIEDGRVTIPKKVRKEQSICTGDFVEIQVKKVNIANGA